MLKQTKPALHKTTRTQITSLFGDAKVVLDETPKAISPFGGLASFISFLGQIGFARQVQSHLPFTEPTSNNAIPLAHSLTAFLMAVVAGAQRFAHCEWLRADRVLHAMLGMPRFPSDDTVRNFFLRFSQCHIEAFWRPLWRWLLLLVRCPATGFSHWIWIRRCSAVRATSRAPKKGSIPGARGARAITRCWRCWPKRTSSCMAGCAAATRVRRAASCRSCRRRWPSCRREPGFAPCGLTAVSLKRVC